MKLEIGYRNKFEVRVETCISNCQDKFSILYLSDLHLNKFSNKLVTDIIDAICELNPTIILLGGDYVDTKRGLTYFKRLLNFLSSMENVFAVAGNHDYFFGIDEISNCFINNNIVWLENKSQIIKIRDTVIRIDGNLIMEALLKVDMSILLLHKPVNIAVFNEYYNIAFAGHLHGGQFVFWSFNNKLFPGRLFYKWNILKTELNNCLYFISKGLGDTLPIRYNCKKDILFIKVNIT